MKSNENLGKREDHNDGFPYSPQLGNFRKPLIILMAGIVLAAIAPYFFTRDWGVYALANNSGNIGDTIGGITAPITSLIGSILVFYALQAQIDANNQIQLQFHKQVKADRYLPSVQYISKQIDIVGQEIQLFQYHRKEKGIFKVDGHNFLKNVVYNGPAALELLISDATAQVQVPIRYSMYWTDLRYSNF